MTDSCDEHGGDGTEDERVHLDMGLPAFPGEEASCPKCLSFNLKILWHPAVIFGHTPEHPCAAWVMDGLLTGQVEQHLCLRCTRCGYGWPSRAADSA